MIMMLALGFLLATDLTKPFTFQESANMTNAQQVDPLHRLRGILRGRCLSLYVRNGMSDVEVKGILGPAWGCGGIFHWIDYHEYLGVWVTYRRETLRGPGGAVLHSRMVVTAVELVPLPKVTDFFADLSHSLQTSSN